MPTQLPKEKKNYIIIEPTKITVALFTVLIGLVGWLGKTSFDKLTSIESDVKVLLVAKGINETKIDDIKEEIRRGRSDPAPVPISIPAPSPVKRGRDKGTAGLFHFEFIIPEGTFMSISKNPET